ncbi:hypothetical protein KHO57_gp055 [Mycobacterium phage Phabba]|uniref:Uncharacterized protein n=1 Tax=Mycobacterium phage Phabba TaxID=2027899 RepID=A0A249XSK0_9CAUD|nr:hypothetical protein KHO57_gp055 [Mycobacterium phage Phabba]ASZ74630.1 hypothetical protein SEA_PHABBA_55 [Mycobacterium phage Phabba]
MSNAPVTAAQITTHDEWIAFYTANVSPFAAEQIGEDIVAKAQAGDYYEAMYVAGQNASIARLEAMTDEQLVAEYNENIAGHLAMIELDDPSEYDVNDHESYYHAQYLIEALRVDRDVRARYMSAPAPLTHSPFAALAA